MSQDPTNVFLQSKEFVRLWTANSRKIFSYIATIVPDWSEAEDIFQETGVVVWEKFHEYEPGTDFCAWARRIAYFKMLSNTKIRERWKIVDKSIQENLLSETAEMTDLLEYQHEALSECVKKLSSKDRNLLYRRYHKDQSVKQIALQFGRSLDAIYKALQRIHDNLFECVNQGLYLLKYYDK